MKSYVHSLEIQDKVDVYMEVLEEFQASDVGWALIPERKVYIRPTVNIQKIEAILAHELTHIALADEGYRIIGCYEGDTLCISFANLLHHLILYPRIIASGFSLKEDTTIVMNKLKEKSIDYKTISIEYGEEGLAYAVIQIVNDIIRLDPSRKDEYLTWMNKETPHLIHLAQGILEKVYKINANVEGYNAYKNLLERELNIQSEFTFLNDL